MIAREWPTQAKHPFELYVRSNLSNESSFNEFRCLCRRAYILPRHFDSHISTKLVLQVDLTVTVNVRPRVQPIRHYDHVLRQVARFINCLDNRLTIPFRSAADYRLYQPSGHAREISRRIRKSRPRTCKNPPFSSLDMARSTGTKRRRRSSVSRNRKRPRSNDQSDSEDSNSTRNEDVQEPTASNASMANDPTEEKDAISKFNTRWKVGERTDQEVLGKL